MQQNYHMDKARQFFKGFMSKFQETQHIPLEYAEFPEME